ncbi:hypothetical protein BDK51DRAFT_25464 [Blyttiomyces helicus]|uniref:Uncharacterized protein n=1 Tax=Blyttiomyces helicus TaxID=388810 RepID=A0A4V1IQS8_9FUNG|nr:hypothetical protein BDK51DRAFT_25464 [Blyttiomyces helicus]|eukprot:RKO87607.1 hypothetical protein BDK51DRAFT_25464 [Blyttiomyces helicus]
MRRHAAVPGSPLLPTNAPQTVPPSPRRNGSTNARGHFNISAKGDIGIFRKRRIGEKDGLKRENGVHVGCCLSTGREQKPPGDLGRESSARCGRRCVGVPVMKGEEIQRGRTGERRGKSTTCRKMLTGNGKYSGRWKLEMGGSKEGSCEPRNQPLASQRHQPADLISQTKPRRRRFPTPPGVASGKERRSGWGKVVSDEKSELTVNPR